MIGIKSSPVTLLQVLQLSAASDFHTSATSCVCETKGLLRPSWQTLIHFFLVSEQLLDARTLRGEEVWIYFRGDALDLSEFENVDVSPSEISIIPLGISHSVMCLSPEDQDFLRLNFYSKVRWRVPIDPTKHYFDSNFEIKTTVHKPAEWRKNLRRRGESESHEIKVDPGH